MAPSVQGGAVGDPNYLEQEVSRDHRPVRLTWTPAITSLTPGVLGIPFQSC